MRATRESRPGKGFELPFEPKPLWIGMRSAFGKQFRQTVNSHHPRFLKRRLVRQFVPQIQNLSVEFVQITRQFDTDGSGFPLIYNHANYFASLFSLSHSSPLYRGVEFRSPQHFLFWLLFILAQFFAKELWQTVCSTDTIVISLGMQSWKRPIKAIPNLPYFSLERKKIWYLTDEKNIWNHFYSQRIMSNFLAPRCVRWTN